MSEKHTPGQRVVDALWPSQVKFETEWGTKTRKGLAECIDTLTATSDLLDALNLMLGDLETIHGPQDAKYYFSEWGIGEDEAEENLPAFMRGVDAILDYIRIQVPVARAAIAKATNP